MVFSGILLPGFGAQNNWNGVGGQQQPTVGRKSIYVISVTGILSLLLQFYSSFLKSLFFF